MTWNPAVHELTFLCSHCGWHPDNTARWCGSGCGSDYNRMIPTERAEALDAAGEKVRELERRRMDANERNMMEACDECNERLEATEAALQALHAAEPSRAENAKLRERVRDLEAERQHILDCINLYGDTTLHAALDAADLLRDHGEKP